MIIDPPSNDPTYHSQVDSITSDKRGRVTPRSALRRMMIPLDNAFNAQPFRVNGDFIFFDSNSTGVATVQLNNTSEDPWPALALSGVTDIPITDIYLTSAAQAGKVLNLWYGYRARFLNPVQAIATIGSILNPVRVQDTGGSNINVVTVSGSIPLQASFGAWATRDVGYAYGTSFSSQTALAQNTASVFVAPGTNVNGMVLWDATQSVSSAVAYNSAFVAKASVPATVIDGDPILVQGGAGAAVTNQNLQRSVFIATGKGLYAISSQAEGQTFKRMLLTIF